MDGRVRFLDRDASIVLTYKEQGATSLISPMCLPDTMTTLQPAHGDPNSARREFGGLQKKHCERKHGIPNEDLPSFEEICPERVSLFPESCGMSFCVEKGLTAVAEFLSELP